MTPRTTHAVSALVILLLAAPAAAQPVGQAGTKPATYLAATPAAAQPPATTPGWARVSFFADGAWSTYTDGTTNTFSEFVTTVAVQSPIRESGGIEYRLDMRAAGYPSSQNRPTRASLYEAYVGMRWDDGRLGFKAGQLWLNDLGALGSVGGAAFESRWPVGGGTMRLRFGAFGGLEPDIQTLNYATGVRKFGGYAVLESPRGLRRHVIGYVNIRHSGLTERSVITFQNFVPLLENKIFIYQAAEYDLVGPAGMGSSHLSYFFANGRLRPSRRLELSGTFHRGRSIDTRGITLDQLNGRPIDQKALDGFLYESVGGRVSYEVVKNVRVFGGYTRDRNNVGDAPRQRMQFGAWMSNVGQTGFDINVTEWRILQAGMTTYNSLYVSVGRSLLPRVYVSGEYNQSVSTLRLLTGGAFTLISRPETHRYAVSGTFRVNRQASVLCNVERMDDSTSREYRVLAGLTYRF
jgi:hypothetical protein